MRSRGLWAAAVLIPGFLASVSGQAPLQFDAATIKPDQRGPGDRGLKGGPGTKSPGRVTWNKVWLASLVAEAFQVDLIHVSGPDWISRNGAQLYAFSAIMPPTTSKHAFELMLQAFLIEQFRMRLHHEPRMFPAYELVVASGGTKLKASADPDAPDIPVYKLLGRDADGFPIMPPGHGAVGSLNRGGHYAKFQNFTMSEFAEYYAGDWVTPQGDPTHYVLDKTGLQGMYDFTLKFDDGGGATAVVGTGVQAATGARDASEPGSGLPNIFKAVEQQLGLKLVKIKDIPRDTIVIDHAERTPAGN